MAARGTLFSRGGIWWWDLRVAGQRRIVKSLETKSRKVAEARRKSLLALQDAQRWPIGTDPLLMDLPALVETSYRARGRPSTLVEAVRIWKAFVATCRAQTLAGVTRADVDRYVAARRKAGVAAKTVNKEMDLLRAGINRLCPGAENPFANYGRLREDDSREILPVPLEMVQRYLLAAQGWVRDELLFIVWTGARLSSMHRSRVGDVRPAEGRMRVPLWKTSQSLTDRYAWWPIPPDLQPILERYMAAKPPDALLFPPRAKNALRKALQRLAKRQGLPYYHPHQFRHTWATVALAQTGDVRSVMEMGGWRRWETLRRYAQSDLAAKTRVVEAVQAALTAGWPRPAP